MRSPLILALALVAACQPAVEDHPKDTAATDTGSDTDADTDTASTDDPDRDGDGYPASTDCDDTRADVNPGVAADVCNGRDDDCDAAIDEDPDLTWYLDADKDGFGAAGSSSFVSCDPGGDTYSTNDADCDDGNVAVYPGADEVCNGVDDDCNGATDDNEALWVAFYADVDGDGAGDPDSVVYGCDAASAGGADNGWDCDDADAREPVFVDPTGSARGTGRVEDPLASIQSAIVASRECVTVAAGTYTEDLDFRGRDIAVMSLAGAAATIVQGTGRAPVVTFDNAETADAVLDGFTLTGGGGDDQTSTDYYWDGSEYVYEYGDFTFGGGVYISYASPTLRNLVIEDNVLQASYSYYVGATDYYYGGSYGAGLYLYGGDPTLTDVDFIDNSAAVGAAVYHNYDGTLTATRVGIYGSSGGYGTIYQYSATEDWENLVLDANASEYGYSGFYTDSSTLTITNATIVSNEYAVYNSGSDVSLSSSIVTGNGVGVCDGYVGYSTWTLRYNDFYDNDSGNYVDVDDPTGSSGNISSNPSFSSYTDNSDWAGDVLQLGSRSPAIDAGDPAPARDDADGSPNDMGAFGGPAGVW